VDRELDPQELSSLCAAARVIGVQIAMAATGDPNAVARLSQHALIIDGRELRKQGYNTAPWPCSAALGLRGSWTRIRATSGRQ